MQGYHKHESVMSKDELENDEFMKNLFKKKSEIKGEDKSESFEENLALAIASELVFKKKK